MNYYNEIKTKLIENEKYAIIKDYSKERYKVQTYYEVGRMLSEAGKHYGDGIIKEYSNKLTKELGKGYNTTSLKRMRQFYITVQKSAPLGYQLTWSHYREHLIIKDKNIKSIEENKTIGIIICKKDNHFIMEYYNDPRILSREYRLLN